MSVSTEVQRTLVKSPPELWTELSNPESLARHLGDFGEIRITKTEPETKVEWEAEHASGVVQLKQSGWGTKVTLSVTRTPSVPEQSSASEPAIVAEPEPEPDLVAAVEDQPAGAAESESAAVTVEPESAIVEPTADKPTADKPIAPKPTAVEPGPAPVVARPEPESEPVAAKPEPRSESVAPVEPDPEPSSTKPEPRPGFFARLFKRKAKPTAVESESVAAAELDVAPKPASPRTKEPEIEVVALAAPEPIYPTRLPAPLRGSPDMVGARKGDPPAQPQASEPAEDLATELESLEEQMAAETTELLTGLLDRLGAAHHRPFSRG